MEDLAAAQGCDSLHWIKLLEGLAMGVQCFLGEAPFLFISGVLLDVQKLHFQILMSDYLFIHRMDFKKAWTCSYNDDDFIGYGCTPHSLLLSCQSMAHFAYRFTQRINIRRVLVDGICSTFYSVF